MSAIINLICFILLLYMISWFAQKLKQHQDALKSINGKLDAILKKFPEEEKKDDEKK
ncbi:hypothetical protein ABET51_17025 [Metabacillus fastidiosus]|uniref:hypothetical protein n=1 Tax=Metabacillus fastidiosus TaxID=1458 RepID=UPI002E2457B4|nr:hypothetical protein [Metabacillus fastidiosus]